MNRIRPLRCGLVVWVPIPSLRMTPRLRVVVLRSAENLTPPTPSLVPSSLLQVPMVLMPLVIMASPERGRCMWTPVVPCSDSALEMILCIPLTVLIKVGLLISMWLSLALALAPLLIMNGYLVRRMDLLLARLCYMDLVLTGVSGVSMCTNVLSMAHNAPNVAVLLP